VALTSPDTGKKPAVESFLGLMWFEAYKVNSVETMNVLKEMGKLVSKIIKPKKPQA